MLTQNQLKHFLHYDPDTGLFTWRNPTSKKYQPGDATATSAACGGYLRVGVAGKRYLAHRLAWLYVHGELHDLEIDHINQNKTDNRISNLRLATRTQNAHNVLNKKNNKSGVKGVSWDADRQRWRAQINVNGKRHYIGLFDDVESAGKAYADWATKHHTHRARS